MKKIMKESFRDIPGYEGFYQASDQGRIKRLSRKNSVKERILKPCIASGYYIVNLCKNNKCKLFLVHRLVLLAFVGESNGLECNHKNCIKTDNRLENLEYVTAKENTLHSWRNGKSNVDHLKKKVDQLDLKGNSIKTFPSIMDAERKLGIDHPSISACCLGKLKTAGKFKWKFNKGGKNYE